MLKSVASVLLLLACLGSLNLHVFLLQMAGWATMVPRYAAEAGSWQEGVRETFSGERPCSLCRTSEAQLAASVPESPAGELLLPQRSNQLLLPWPNAANLVVIPALKGGQNLLELMPEWTLLATAPPSPPPRRV